MAEQLAGPPDEAVSGRVWTVPNALSMLRLLGVPVFLYLLLVVERDGLAILLLMAAGFSDWLDGQIARRYNAYTRLGQLLDPLADRLYILATLAGLVLRDGIPWWWATAIVGRDVLLGVTTLPYLRKHGYGPLPVHFLGKAATFNLLFAFPMLLAALPGNDGLLADVFRPLGWAFAAWGSALYLWAGVLYAVQVRQVVAAAKREQQDGAPAPAAHDPDRPLAGD
ncbi:MAG TPA: CDP-alcohol phosphatidyltransferase family protein [Mycobacteriales bacterium]|nr:CDP-alcohol phosphatidyltransferase family protein [Mycobacteriales bacterium]